jgi:dimethylargininase
MPEVAGVGRVLENYRRLEAILPPGTVDGGDLLRIDNTIYAGLSTRSNANGIEQLRQIVADFGFIVKAVATTKCLHLKSAVSLVAPGVLLINRDWTDISTFGDYELIDVDEEEAHAANALLVGQSLICPSSFPRTIERLVARGIDVIPVNLSELQKAEGATTCCSLIFTAPSQTYPGAIPM